MDGKEGRGEDGICLSSWCFEPDQPVERISRLNEDGKKRVREKHCKEERKEEREEEEENERKKRKEKEISKQKEVC